MATRHVSEYVCDMDEYHGYWKAPILPFVAIPFAAVAILVILAIIVL